MRGFSKAIVAGNVTRDPEMRTTPSGAQVCSFTIAVNRVYRDSGGNQQDQTSFIDCVAWGKSAEIIAQYVKKGSGLLVSGRLDQRSWEDKTTGQKRSRVEINVEDFSFIGGSANGGGASFGGGNSGANAPRRAAPAAGGAADFGGEVVPDDVPEDQINLDDIPF